MVAMVHAMESGIPAGGMRENPIRMDDKRGYPHLWKLSEQWEPPFGNRRVFSQKSPVFLGRSCQANMEIDRAERGCDSPPWQWKITH